MPARISVEELKMDMPCSLESYFANDAKTCQDAATAELGSRLSRVDDLLALYYGDLPKSCTHLNKQLLSALEFYVIILGMYELRNQTSRR